MNRDDLTLQKGKDDMSGTVNSATGAPEAFKFVCRGTVSGARRDAIRKFGETLGIRTVTIWAGSEFEENLRLRGEFLLKRFVEGVVFPDDGKGLRKFVSSFAELEDEEMLRMIGMLFERPAFWTPFHQESSLPAFLRAIEDTIGALSTGVWKTRDDIEIRRIPSLWDIRDAKVRKGLEKMVRQLDDLRQLFKCRLNEGLIEHCDCSDPHCPTFILHGSVGTELDDGRNTILIQAERLIPGFNIRVK